MRMEIFWGEGGPGNCSPNKLAPGIQDEVRQHETASAFCPSVSNWGFHRATLTVWLQPQSS